MIMRDPNNKKGQMLVLAALSVSALVVLVGFGVDLTNLMIRQYQLQRALDAAVLNSIIYTETNLTREMNNENIVDKAVDIIKYGTIGNLKMMGIPVKDDDILLDKSIDPETGIFVFLSGEKVKTESSGCGLQKLFDDPGCDRPENVSSIKICVVAKLKAKTLLLNFIGFDSFMLKATSCSRRITAAIALVLDTSGSMTGQPLIDLKEGAKAFIGEFQDDIDMIAIISFDTQAKVLQPMMRIADAGGKSALYAIIDRLVAKGDTNIAEGIGLAREELMDPAKVPPPTNNEPGAFKTIVLFSDGAPTTMTVDWLRPRTATESPVLLPKNMDLPPTADDEYIAAFADNVDFANHPAWRGPDRLSLNFTRSSDFTVFYGREIGVDSNGNPITPIPGMLAFYESLRGVNPYKGHSDVWTWQPLAPNSTGSPLYKDSPLYRDNTNNSNHEPPLYVYTIRSFPSGPWHNQMLVPGSRDTLVASDGTFIPSSNVPCSSDGWGHAGLNNQNSYYYFMWDAWDCLREYTYKDSKGAEQDEFGYVYGKWITYMNSLVPVLQETYHLAIIEGDYALKEGITIYAIGLAKNTATNNNPPGTGGGIGTGIGTVILPKTTGGQ